MGQRSQIYIRYNGNLKVANYYQWNFGERMISRARSIIERLDDEYIKCAFDDGRIKRYCDVNFDMRDIVLSHDIFQEYKEYGENENFNNFVFDQDNNDGQLFIDVTQKNLEKPIIKYCFVEYYTSKKILDGKGYMNWNCRYNYKIKNWEKYLSYGKEAKKKIIKYTRKNIAYLQENAILMTYDELQNFINANYDENGNQIKSLPNEVIKRIKANQ